MDVLQLNTSTGRVQQVALTALPANSLRTEVYNSSGALIPRGSLVYLNGSHGNLPQIALSKADTELTSARTFGMVEGDISDNHNGFVITAGIISNLDTFGITEGLVLYLSGTVAGGYTTVKPASPNHLVSIGICNRAHPTFGSIEISIVNGFELDELHNVLITTPALGDVLTYINSSTNRWQNSSVLTSLTAKINDNDGMGARIIPNSGASMTIGLNYESFITKKMFVLGKLILNGRLTVKF